MSKKALLIGINYRGTNSELRGCINDVEHMKEYLLKHGYKEADLTILTDDTELKPTRENIIRGIFELVMSKADQLFLHYSGHGSWQPDISGDEADKKDESLVPIDYKQSGMIIDDEIRGLLCLMSPKSKLTAVLDCCHSGTGMDLAYNYKINVGWTRVKKNNKYIRVKQVQSIMEKDGHYYDTPGKVVLLSGCLDPQTSADAYEEKEFQGALTFSILKSLQDGKSKNWDELITNVRNLLKQNKYTQIANLTSGKPLNLKEELIFC